MDLRKPVEIMDILQQTNIEKANIKKEMEYSPKNCFESDKKILQICGLYPIWFENDYKGNKAFFYTRAFITIPVSVIFFILNWVELFLNLDDSALVIKTLYYGLTQTNFICKLFNIYLNYNKFKELISYLNSDNFNSYNEEQYKYIDSAMRIVKWFRYTFRTAVFMSFVFFSVFPFLNDEILPLSSYSPVDVVKYRPYLFVYQMFAALLDGYGQSSLDIMVCSMMSVGSAQLDVLMNNLVNLRKNLDNVNEHKDYNDAVVKDRLASCVQHHVDIISYLMKLESLFSFVQFLQFISSSIIICATGFQVLMTPFADIKIIALLLYFGANMIELTMFCWFGEDVKSKSENVGNACYNSDWPNCSTNNCKTLIIIMERAKRPIVLTGGKFFEFSMETLMQVLKTSYSYLALLDRLYS